MLTYSKSSIWYSEIITWNHTLTPQTFFSPKLLLKYRAIIVANPVNKTHDIIINRPSRKIR